MSPSFWSGAAIGVILVVLFWLFVFVVLVIAVMFMVLGPFRVLVLILLLALFFRVCTRSLKASDVQSFCGSRRSIAVSVAAYVGRESLAMFSPSILSDNRINFS